MRVRSYLRLGPRSSEELLKRLVALSAKGLDSVTPQVVGVALRSEDYQSGLGMHVIVVCVSHSPDRNRRMEIDLPEDSIVATPLTVLSTVIYASEATLIENSLFDWDVPGLHPKLGILWIHEANVVGNGHGTARQPHLI